MTHFLHDYLKAFRLGKTAYPEPDQNLEGAFQEKQL